MTVITYPTILTKAKNIKKNVETKYELGEASTFGYYFAKAILKPNDVTKITIKAPTNYSGDYFSRQIYHSTYINMAERLVKYVEKNKQLPSTIKVDNKLMKVSDYVYMFARILVYYDNNKKYPAKANVNSKSFTKPIEYKNEVYKYFVQKTGKAFKTIDDLLAYVKAYFQYEKYFDDHKSNKQVIDSKAGNCTDLLQFLCNMAEEMGYSWKCIHVKCRSSRTGHVFGKFKHPKHTEGNWITRDIACVADGGDIRCVWCKDGIVQAENPSWWMANLNR